MPQERNVQRSIIKALRDEGFWAGKLNIDGRIGYPDLLVLGNGKVCLIEVKADDAERRRETARAKMQAVRRRELGTYGIPSIVAVSPEEAVGFARKHLTTR